MKKHSPNFHENLHEADTSTFDRGAACIWTIVLIIVTVLLFSVTAKAQKSADTTYLITNYRLSGKEISAEEYYKHAKKRYLFGSVIDDGSELQIFKQDTIPVVMMVSDTAENKHQRRICRSKRKPHARFNDCNFLTPLPFTPNTHSPTNNRAFLCTKG